METVTLRITEVASIELPIVHQFAPGLVLAGFPDQGYEVVHTPTGLGLISGASNFQGRLMDFGRAFSQLKIDWMAQDPMQAASKADREAAIALRQMYLAGLESPAVNYIED
jgi:hypothetical protein